MGHIEDYYYENRDLIDFSNSFEDFLVKARERHPNVMSFMKKYITPYHKRMYLTIKEHGHRYWAKALYYPTVNKLDELFDDFVVASERPEGYAFLWPDFEVKHKMSGHICTPIDTGRGVARVSGEYYCTWVKPNKKLLPEVSPNQSFRLIKQSGLNECLLITPYSDWLANLDMNACDPAQYMTAEHKSKLYAIRETEAACNKIREDWLQEGAQRASVDLQV